MTAEQFVRAIENVFGPYRDGMRIVVADWAENCTTTHLQNLLHQVVRTHDCGFPPTLAKLIDVGAHIEDCYHYPLLEEPPLTDVEREEMAANLKALLADLARRKAAFPKKEKK